MPPEPFLSWLERHNAIFVNNNDFDHLMYLVRREFNLDHPQIDRFERMLLRYDAQYTVYSDLEGNCSSKTPFNTGIKLSLQPASQNDSKHTKIPPYPMRYISMTFIL
jgi:hypothetical protein